MLVLCIQKGYKNPFKEEKTAITNHSFHLFPFQEFPFSHEGLLTLTANLGRVQVLLSSGYWEGSRWNFFLKHLVK